MQFINYLLDVTDWELCRPGFGDAMTNHACFMAGVSLDDIVD